MILLTWVLLALTVSFCDCSSSKFLSGSTSASSKNFCSYAEITAPTGKSINIAHKCLVCNQIRTDPRILLTHLQESHTDRYLSNFYAIHSLVEHGADSQNVFPEYSEFEMCPNCHFQFPKTLLALHSEYFHSPYCQMTLEYANGLRQAPPPAPIKPSPITRPLYKNGSMKKVPMVLGDKVSLTVDEASALESPTTTATIPFSATPKHSSKASPKAKSSSKASAKICSSSSSSSSATHSLTSKKKPRLQANSIIGSDFEFHNFDFDTFDFNKYLNSQVNPTLTLEQTK